MDRNAANFVALTPVSFLERSAEVYPDKVAVIHGGARHTYREFGARVRRLASVLHARGVGRGDTVAIMAPNVPALLEAHYAVPGLGAILNALNYRLDAATIAFCLDHGDAKVLITDREFSPVIAQALKKLGREIFVVDIDDAMATAGERLGAIDYETWIARGNGEFRLPGPVDEWDSAALLYTSGTTGNTMNVIARSTSADRSSGQVMRLTQPWMSSRAARIPVAATAASRGPIAA